MASTYLERAKTGTDGNRQIWTISVWVKRGTLGSEQKIFSFGENISSEGNLYFDANDFLVLQNDFQNGGSNETDMVFRDTSAWYHIVWACDSTQADNANRWKVYVNGEQVTLTGSPTITQNGNGSVNAWAAHDLWIGRTARVQQSGTIPNSYFDGSMTHVHFIDGTQYAASDFGQTNAASGIWTPKTSPSVTYGTNGFFLKFANSGSLGTDSSGNANNFTVNGTGTQTLDTPSNVFATWNPLKFTENATFSYGNTRYDGDDVTSQSSTFTTLAASSGKYYFEVKQVAAGGNYPFVGIVNVEDGDENSGDTNISSRPDSFAFSNAGGVRNNGSYIVANGTYTSTVNGDIISVAVDCDNSKIYFAVNGTWQNSADPAAGTGGLSITADKNYAFALASYNGAEHHANFGNGYFGTTAVASGNADGDGYGIFEYAPPTGYYALCTKNINTYG